MSRQIAWGIKTYFAGLFLLSIIEMRCRPSDRLVSAALNTVNGISVWDVM
jgi:hypothetical protein